MIKSKNSLSSQAAVLRRLFAVVAAIGLLAAGGAVAVATGGGFGADRDAGYTQYEPKRACEAGEGGEICPDEGRSGVKGVSESDDGSGPEGGAVLEGFDAGVLPFTGRDALPLVIAGMVLILLGLAQRRFTADRA